MTNENNPSRASGQAGVVCVDLDGVLAQYKASSRGQHPDVFMIGEPIEGAIGFIESLLKEGFVVIVDSVRLNTAQFTPSDHGKDHLQGDRWHEQLVKSLRQWLSQWGFPAQGEKFYVNAEPGKPAADAYVGDKAVECDFSEIQGTAAKKSHYAATLRWIRATAPQP